MPLRTITVCDNKHRTDYIKKINIENCLDSDRKINFNEQIISQEASQGIKSLILGGILYNYNVNLNYPKKMPKNIEFQYCNTLNEALNFGKNFIGIKNYYGFLSYDTDVVNWINQGLIHVNNAFKGKAVMPNQIVYYNLIGEPDDLIGGCMTSDGNMIISKDYINTIKNAVKSYFDGDKYSRYIDKIEERKNFTRWINAFIKIINNIPELAEKLNLYTSTYSVISHEMGHFQHCINKKSNLADLKKNFAEVFEESKQIALCVSKYAGTSPTEFVAECFAQMADGIKLDNDVMKLYKKLGGLVV